MKAIADPRAIVIEVHLRGGGVAHYRLPERLWAPLLINVDGNTYSLQPVDPARRFPVYKLGGAPVFIEPGWKLPARDVEAA